MLIGLFAGGGLGYLWGHTGHRYQDKWTGVGLLGGLVLGYVAWIVWLVYKDAVPDLDFWLGQGALSHVLNVGFLTIVIGGIVVLFVHLLRQDS